MSKNLKNNKSKNLIYILIVRAIRKFIFLILNTKNRGLELFKAKINQSSNTSIF